MIINDKKNRLAVKESNSFAILDRISSAAFRVNVTARISEALQPDVSRIYNIPETQFKHKNAGS